MSFDTDVIISGRGRAIRVDISTDSFATITYRYSDVPGALDGTNQYEPRVLNLGTVRRALGQNRVAGSSTTSLKLANADGVVDWICGRENINTAKLARFRIYVALYDPDATVLTFTSKMLGDFVLSSWPSQNNAEVMLNLADDFMGRLGAGLLLPTLLDWQQVGTVANNPIKNSIGIPQSIGQNAPVQLAFGEDALLAMPYIIPHLNNGVTQAYYEKIIIPLYSTTDTSAVSQDLVQQVVVDSFRLPPTSDSAQETSPSLTTLPRTIYDNVALVDRTVWTVEKSPTISKGGLSFQIVYLVVRTDMGDLRMRYVPVTNDEQRIGYEARVVQLSSLAFSNGYPEGAVWSAGLYYQMLGARITKVYVRAAPKSQRTNAPVSVGFGISHAVDVVTDLVSVYSAATIDTASAARVKAGSPFAAATGVVQPWTERANNPSIPLPPFSLRQALTELTQSSDFDIFVNWSGAIAFASDVFDFTTATQAGTIVEILETELNPGITRWVASDGERGSPFNRVSFEGGKPDPVSHQDIPFQGPFDLAAAEIPTSSGVIETVLRQGWRPFRQQALNPWQWRSVDSVTRDRVRFSMHIGGLRLELGNYFKLTWTRGPEVSGPYEGTIFQCEAIAYSPDGDTVEVEGIWRDDTVAERQYLLDDETLIVRGKGALTGSATTGAASITVNFGGTINLATMGVVVGDILVLRDTAEAADLFTRNLALRILTIPTSASVTVTTALATAGVVINADWSIVRGSTTYPTAISDPTNYPNGGDMYGKATAADGTTSDAQTGNRLMSG